MSTREGVVAVGLTIALGFSAFTSVRLWQGRVRLHSDPLRLLGPRGWRAFGRGLPLLGVAVPLAFLLALPAASAPLLRVLALALLVAAVLATLSVALLNRPSVLVPPERREERGLIEELRRGPADCGPAAPRWDFDRAEAPVADRAPADRVSTYRDLRLAAVQAAFFAGAAALALAVCVTWLGDGVAGLAVGGLCAGVLLQAVYRVLVTSVTADDRTVVVANGSDVVTLSWDDVERFEIVTGDARGRLVHARLRTGATVRAAALESPQLRPRSHDAWAHGVVSELNARLRQSRERQA
jgi:hypothetical protein